MSGLAVVVDARGIAPDDLDARRFLQDAGEGRELGSPAFVLAGPTCLAAKFNDATSIHTQAAVDPATGSWLLAAGTLIDPQDVTADGSLDGLLADLLGAQGLTALGRCEGLFGLVFFDARTREVIVASDPLGHFSVFHAEGSGRTYVSTSALALARHVRAAPETTAVWTFLLTGKVFGPATLWDGVARIMPGVLLSVGPAGSSRTTYWRLEPDPTLGRLNLAEAVDASVERLTTILRRNLAREGAVWCDLTGGFDSRFLAMLLERAEIPFTVDSVGPPGHPDVAIARRIVRRLGWPHEFLQVPASWAADAVVYSRRALRKGDAHLNVFLLARAIWVHEQERSRHRLLLNGLGGEMWRGLIWWPEGRNVGASSVVHYERQLWSLMHPVPLGVIAGEPDPVVRADLSRLFRAAAEVNPDEPNTLKLDRLWAFRETGHAGAWSSAPAGIIRVLPPLFSASIIRHLVSLDWRHRRRNSVVRHAFARYRPHLADIPIEGRGPAAPLGPRNAHQFLMSRLQRTGRIAGKASQILFRRSIGSSGREEGFSRRERRQTVLDSMARGRQIELSDLHSAALYRPRELRTLLDAAAGDAFAHDEFLGRVVTLELAFRYVGTGAEPAPAPHASVSSPIGAPPAEPPSRG